jgi:GNAT superfamily N-acetyltransferase
VTIRSRAEETVGDAAFDQELAEFLSEADIGRPDPYAFAHEPAAGYGIELARRRVAAEHARASPDRMFLARHEGRLIGLTVLGDARPDGEVQQGDTVVHPRWRRRGIAAALKVRGILRARALGYTSIRTSTASAAMLALNLRLGFEPLEATLRLVRLLDSAE